MLRATNLANFCDTSRIFRQTIGLRLTVCVRESVHAQVSDQVGNDGIALLFFFLKHMTAKLRFTNCFI